MPKVAISFDDGILSQYKWARALHHYGIEGTFYINPFAIGFKGFLSLPQLERMHDEWGHVIANHFWTHECPKNNVSTEALIASLEYAKKWLVSNGFENGADLVALTFGSEGGRWSPAICQKIIKHCTQIRDVSDGYNDVDEKVYLGASEDTELVFVEGKLNLVYFHQNTDITTDDKMMKLFERMTKCDMTSMREIADV